MAISKRLSGTQSSRKRGKISASKIPQCVGIDFGARTAGTTVIAWNEGHRIHSESSAAGRDADEFLVTAVARLAPQLIAIDAPLSLPGVYRNLKGLRDFHLRECDRAVSAMSPMFLGGLTARAMALAAAWREDGLTVYETYPRQVMTRLGWTRSPRLAQEIRTFFSTHGFQYAVKAPSITPHLLDAWLCLLPWCCNLPLEAVGDKQEGQIYLPRRRANVSA